VDVLNDPSAAAPALSEENARDLLCLAGMMIPASAEYGVPGADDAVIFATILKSLGRDLGHAHAALRDLAALSGGAFADLDPARREEVAASFHAAGGEALAILHRVILLCYYRDDRVMRSLDMEVRPPFPKGFVVEQGDWSLLDPVRERPKLWRDAR
jgi:hypothetical protein